MRDATALTPVSYPPQQQCLLEVCQAKWMWRVKEGDWVGRVVAAGRCRSTHVLNIVWYDLIYQPSGTHA